MGNVLLAIAALVLLAAVVRNIGDPWERGMRGAAPAYYSDGVVSQTLKHGLAETLGMPAFINEDSTGSTKSVNWHHPPLYWLYLTFAAWVVTHEVWVLRVAHLLLFLPGLLALFALVRRRAGSIAAGVVSLLFATSPLVAYFGAMVLQDGAVLGAGLCTMWSFDRHLHEPSWRGWWRTAGLFFLACSLDLTGYFWGVAMFCWACSAVPRWPAVRTVFSLFPVSVAALAVTAVHYGIELGGPLGYMGEMLGELGGDVARVPITRQRIVDHLAEVMVEHVNGPLFVAAIVGVVVALVVRSQQSLALLSGGVALVIPGVLSVAGMFNHALDHVFWSMQAFGGLAVLASIPLVVLRSRVRYLFLAMGALVVVIGGVATHRIITRFAFNGHETHRVIETAWPLYEGCTSALTSAPVVSQSFFHGTQVWAGIDTPEKLAVMLQVAKTIAYRGELAFVVDPGHQGSNLTVQLDAMATRQQVDDVWVYLLRP